VRVLVAYILIGIVLGWAWNRVELKRSGLRGTLPSFVCFLIGWPLVAFYALAVAAIWPRAFEITGNGTEPLPEPPVPAAVPPDPPALTGRTAVP